MAITWNDTEHRILRLSLLVMSKAFHWKKKKKTLDFVDKYEEFMENAKEYACPKSLRSTGVCTHKGEQKSWNIGRVLSETAVNQLL